MNDKEAEGTDVFRFSAMLPSISPFTLPFMHEDEKTDEKTLVKNVLTDMIKNIVKGTQSIIITLFHYELAKLLSYSTIANDSRVVSYSGISSFQANWYSRSETSIASLRGTHRQPIHLEPRSKLWYARQGFKLCL
jgi:hypothetical protein